MPLLFPTRAATLVAFLLVLVASFAEAAKWRPISPEDFAAAPPEFDPTAGAVILLREITIDNGDFDGLEQSTFVRIKVFDRKGIDALLLTRIPYAREQPLRGLAARVVRPDGSAIEVGKDDIFTRELLRVGREALLAKSFSWPALEPGCIIEYQYRVRTPGFAWGMQLELADVHPTRLARIRLRPLPIFGTQSLWSGLPGMHRLDVDKKGFHTYEAPNIPAVVEEPLSPPDSVTKPWFLYYATTSSGGAENYWFWVALQLEAQSRTLLAPNKTLKNTALKLTADIPGDESKLQRLYDFCRTEIKNLSHDACGYTPDQIVELKPNKSPSDVLKNGYGTDTEINLLFGALINALGARCNLAYAGDRSRYIFDRKVPLRDALPRLLVAIAVGSGWRFYDPGSLYLPCGQVRWMSEGTPALLLDQWNCKMIDIPRSPPAYSTTSRRATLRLDANGTIEGDVTIEITGHDGLAAKHEFDGKTADERLAFHRSALEATLGQVEMTNFALHHVDDPDRPFQVSYHLKVEGYAAVTGDRIILQPAVFQKDLPVPFTAPTRVHGIQFPYAYVVDDEISFALPAGFELEEPKAPAPINVTKLLFYEPEIRYSETSHRLTLHRKLTFDGESFVVAAYDPIKQTFDRLARQDAHALALKRSDDPSVAATAEAPETSTP